MQFKQLNFCPSCGQHSFAAVSVKEFRCSHCQYRYFHNAAAAVAALIVCGDEVLLANRAFEPSKGLYDFPGGFIDPGESFESGLCRELQEELQWQPRPEQLQYLFSSHNQYHYADVDYVTADVFFVIELDTKPVFNVLDDVAHVTWFALDQIDASITAFPVVMEAIKRLTAR